MNYELIKEIALSKGLSIPKLADKISFSKRGLYFAISKKTMAIDTLEDIAKALDVSITVFFDDDSQKFKSEDLEKRLAIVEKILFTLKLL